MNLAEVADELYALTPGEFRPARDERATQARAAGDRELADAIKKLRRPTVSAWLVNQLVRDAADQVDRLLELAEPLREAQQALDADRLRELSAQRRRAVAAITQEAKRLAAQASQSFGAQAEREVEATVEAALADTDATDAVRSGRLTSAISYAGLGGVDLSDAVAVPGASPVRPRRPKRREPSASPGETKRHDAAKQESTAAGRKARDAELAKRDLQEAAAQAEEAEAELRDAEHEVADAREKHHVIQREIEELEQRLEQSQALQAQFARKVRDAQRSRDVAVRSLESARRRLSRAEARAGQPVE